MGECRRLAGETPIAPASDPTGPSARPRRGRRRLWAGLGAVAAILVVVLILWIGGIGPFGGKTAAGPAVTVTASTLSFSPARDPCFQSEYGTREPGTLAPGGTYILLTKLSIDQYGSVRNCTVESVAITTPGFSLLAANVPLFVPAVGGATLNISVTVPSVAYTGQLNLTAVAAFTSPNVNATNRQVSRSTSNSTFLCGISGVSGGGPFLSFSSTEVNDSVSFIVTSPFDSCIITSVSTSTSGFRILSSGTPYQLPIDSFAGVTFVLLTPSASYNGTVSLTLKVTATSG